MPVYRKLTLITYARMPNERTENGNELSIRTEEKKNRKSKKREKNRSTRRKTVGVNYVIQMYNNAVSCG